MKTIDGTERYQMLETETRKKSRGRPKTALIKGGHLEDIKVNTRNFEKIHYKPDIERFSVNEEKVGKSLFWTMAFKVFACKNFIYTNGKVEPYYNLIMSFVNDKGCVGPRNKLDQMINKYKLWLELKNSNDLKDSGGYTKARLKFLDDFHKHYITILNEVIR